MKKKTNFNDLVKIMAKLRAPGGVPVGPRANA